MAAKRRRLAQRRKALGLTQEALAAQLGVDPTTVRRWENGATEGGPQPWLRPKLARLLEVSPEQLDALFADMAAHHLSSSHVAVATRRVGAPFPVVGPDFDTVQAFRTADRQVGGGHLYTSVVQYLHTSVAPRLFAGDGHSLFESAAALTEMAGWMAHDAGRDGKAGQHFSRALDFVRLTADQQLKAHILASMSNLARHREQPQQAVALARQGQDLLADGPRRPALEARLLALEARGQAALRDAGQTVGLLARAEQTLGLTPQEAPSVWVSDFDEGSLASEAANSLHQLGDTREARQQAERVLTLRPAGRTRSRAFGQLALVSALIAQGEPEEACAVTQEILDATPALGSYLVTKQLLGLRQSLAPYAKSHVVAEFLICFDETLRQRLSLRQWQQLGLGPTDQKEL